MQSIDARGTSLNRRGFLASALAGGAWLGLGMPGLPGALQARAYALGGSTMEVLERTPWNAQPAPDALLQSWITPESQFYIRTNGNVPELSEDRFRLEVRGLVERPLSLSMADLRGQFPRVDVLATLQCAGNRRTEMAATKPIDGTPWGITALGNASWTGVRLGDVLRAAGVQAEAAHVWLTGLDVCEVKGQQSPFGGSIPLDKALMEETLLAYAMNASLSRRSMGRRSERLCPVSSVRVP